MLSEPSVSVCALAPVASRSSVPSSHPPRCGLRFAIMQALPSTVAVRSIVPDRRGPWQDAFTLSRSRGRQFAAQMPGRLFSLRRLRHHGSMRPMRRVICSLALLCIAAAPLAAADSTSRTAATTAPTGSRVATAWATLQHAADVVDPGDTVHVLDGNYQGFDLRRSGAPGNPITFLRRGRERRASPPTTASRPTASTSRTPRTS